MTVLADLSRLLPAALRAAGRLLCVHTRVSTGYGPQTLQLRCLCTHESQQQPIGFAICPLGEPYQLHSEAKNKTTFRKALKQMGKNSSGALTFPKTLKNSMNRPVT